MERINRIPQLAAEASLLPAVEPLELLVLREDLAIKRLERGRHVSRQDQRMLLRINASYASGCRRDVWASTIRRARCHGLIRMLST